MAVGERVADGPRFVDTYPKPQVEPRADNSATPFTDNPIRNIQERFAQFLFTRNPNHADIIPQVKVKQFQSHPLRDGLGRALHAGLDFLDTHNEWTSFPGTQTVKRDVVIGFSITAVTIFNHQILPRLGG